MKTVDALSSDGVWAWAVEERGEDGEGRRDLNGAGRETEDPAVDWNNVDTAEVGGLQSIDRLIELSV